MADTYIDPQETLGYGPFAVAQIKRHVVPLDAAFAPALKLVTARLTKATTAMRDVLARAGLIEVATFKPSEGADDPVRHARDVLRRLASYAASRPAGKSLAGKILDGEPRSTVLRRRPAKLVAALDHALEVVRRERAQLPEHADWETQLGTARDRLQALVVRVSDSRVARQQMTPEVAASRDEWLKVYGAAKLLVQSALRLHGRDALLSHVFDDLAEVHRVAGVTDGGERPAAPVAAPTTPSAVPA